MTRQQYIRQVTKHLKCSSLKKREIGRQLDSHIEIALGEGRQLPDILAEMGEPEAIAGEFNENFDENERRKPKGRRLLISLIVLGVLILAVAAGVVWWMIPKQWEIGHSGIFSEEEVQSRTEEVLELFNKKDYEGLIECFAPETRDVLDFASLEEAKKLVSDDWGEFRSLGHAYMAEISQKGVRSAVIQINAVYDNVGVTFTLMYDEHMNVVGFYLK